MNYLQIFHNVLNTKKMFKVIIRHKIKIKVKNEKNKKMVVFMTLVFSIKYSFSL